MIKVRVSTKLTDIFQENGRIHSAIIVVFAVQVILQSEGTQLTRNKTFSD